jgi:hypothetical protein
VQILSRAAPRHGYADSVRVSQGAVKPRPYKENSTTSYSADFRTL